MKLKFVKGSNLTYIYDIKVKRFGIWWWTPKFVSGFDCTERELLCKYKEKYCTHKVEVEVDFDCSRL